MQARLQENLNMYLEMQKKRRHWLMLIVALAIATALIAYSLMFLPALTMVKADFSLEVSNTRVAFSSVVPVRVNAAADAREKEYVIFLISASSLGGGLTAEYVFSEDGICKIKTHGYNENEDEEGIVSLHREWSKDGSSNDRDYWFSLAPGESVSFSLNFISDSFLYDKAEWQISDLKNISLSQPQEAESLIDESETQVSETEVQISESETQDNETKAQIEVSETKTSESQAKTLEIEIQDRPQDTEKPELLPLKKAEEGQPQKLELRAVAASCLEKAWGLLENNKKNQDIVQNLDLIWMKAEELPRSGDPVLSATTESGIHISITGPESAFPADAYLLKLEAKEVKLKAKSKKGISQEKLDLAEKELKEDGLEPLDSLVLDLSVSQDGEKVEFLESVKVKIKGFNLALETDEFDEDALALLYEYEGDCLKEIEAVRQKDGSLNIETSSPSTYAVVLAAGDFGYIPPGGYVWEKPSSTNPFGEAAKFAIFSFGNVERLNNINGPAAIGGNSMGQCQVGVGFSGSPILIFNGSSAANNIQAGNPAKIPSSIYINQNLTQANRKKLGRYIWNDSESDEIAEFADINAFFNDMETRLKAQNESMSTMQANGTVSGTGTSQNPWQGVLTFSGSNPTLNIFTVNATDLSNNRSEWRISVPSGSSVLINVTGGTSIDLIPATTQTAGNMAERVVFNFAPNIKSIKITNHASFRGIMMAPHAEFDTSNIGAGITGNVIVASVKSTGGGLVINGVTPNISLPYGPGDPDPDPDPDPEDKKVSVDFVVTDEDCIEEGRLITLNLKKAGTVIDSVNLPLANGTSYEWSDLPEGDYEINIEGNLSGCSLSIDETVDGHDQHFTLTFAPISAYEMTVEVKKLWEGGTPDVSSVTFHLLANGSFMVPDRTISLSSSNAWKGAFTGLSDVDEHGNPISYSVYESPIAGWSPSVDVTVTPGVISGWKNVTGSGFVSGKTYRFVSGSRALAMTGTGTSDVSGQTNNENSLNQQWRVVAVGGSYYLQNMQYTTYYLRYNKSSSSPFRPSPSSTRTAFTLDSNGRLQSTQYVVMNASNGTVTRTTSTNSATRFTVYAYDEEEVAPKIEFTVTNNNVINPDANIAFPHHKQIDAFRDGVANPDTNLTGDEFYRLYLDARTKGHPMDLVIVIDRSISMSYATTADREPRGNELRRDHAVANLLNGKGGEEGFVSRFLSLNEQNNIAFVWFGGDWYGNGATSGTATLNRLYRQCVDSGIVRGWTKDRNYKVVVNNSNQNASNNICYRGMTSTNYMAGLWEAADMLRSDPIIANNGHKKMVMFLTDGAPTVYVNYASNNSSTPVTYQHYLSWKQNNNNPALYRTGTNGASTGATEVAKSKAAFEDFKLNNPDVIFSSVMFAPPTESTETLQVYHNNGGTMRHTQGDDALPEVFAALIAELTFSQNFSITDYLSKYVNWYSPQPDLKILRTSLLTGAQDIVWQSSGPATSGTIGSGTSNNNVSQDGRQMSIIENVTFNPLTSGDSTGMLQVLFDQDYKVDISNKYTVSFVVKISDLAYEEFAQNKQNGDETGYNGIEGDAGTDYAYNQTSSGKPGFYANSSAILKYRYDGQFYEEPYDHPVVQVTATGIMLRKTNMSGTSLLQNAKFDLYQAAKQGDGGAVLVPGLAGQYGIKINQAPLITGGAGTVYLGNLNTGTYYLVETAAPTGYQMLDEPITFILEGGSISILNAGSMAEVDDLLPDGTPVLLIKNADNYTMPATGGNGYGLFTALSLIMMATSLTLLILKKRRYKREYL